MDVQISRDGKVIGAFSSDLLPQLLATGIIQHDDLAWTEGKADWQLVRVMFPNLTASTKANPPPPKAPRSPEPAPVTTASAPRKPVTIERPNTALIAGWILFALGALIMLSSLWMFFAYGPLFLIALILGTVAISQRKLAGGLALVAGIVIGVPVTWFGLGLTRTHDTLNKTVVSLDGFKRDMEAETRRINSPENLPVQPVHNARPIAPTPAPPPPPQEPVVDNMELLNADLTALDARTLRLAKTYQIESQGTVDPATPAFSQDCRLLGYIRRDPGGQETIVILDLKTLKKKLIHPSIKPTLLIWSPDSTRLIYAGQDFGSYLINISSGTEVRLPLQNVSLKDQYGAGDVWWKTQDEIIFSREGAIWVVSLQSLKAAQKHFDSTEEATEFFHHPTTHPKARIAQADMQDGMIGSTPSLVIGNLDQSYSRPIRREIYNQHPFLASPDLHCIVLFHDNMELLFLSPTKATQYLWSIPLATREVLNAEERAKWQQYINARVPFHAKIYQAAVNPVNNSIVGPDRKYYKGMVTVREWKKDQVILETLKEGGHFAVGDVVADLVSEQSSEFGNWAYGFEDKWFQLQAVDQNDVLKQEGELLRAASDEKSRIAGQLKSKFPQFFNALAGRLPLRLSTKRSPQLEIKAVTFDGATGKFTGVLRGNQSVGPQDVDGTLSIDGTFIFHTQTGLNHGFWKGRVDGSKSAIKGTYVEQLMLMGSSPSTPTLDDPAFELRAPSETPAPAGGKEAAKPADAKAPDLSNDTPASPSAALRQRTWTDPQGRTTQAAFLGIEGESVRLQPENGSAHLVPLAQLSPVDQGIAYDLDTEKTFLKTGTQKPLDRSPTKQDFLLVTPLDKGAPRQQESARAASDDGRVVATILGKEGSNDLQLSIGGEEEEERFKLDLAVKLLGFTVSPRGCFVVLFYGGPSTGSYFASFLKQTGGGYRFVPDDSHSDAEGFLKRSGAIPQNGKITHLYIHVANLTELPFCLQLGLSGDYEDLSTHRQRPFGQVTVFDVIGRKWSSVAPKFSGRRSSEKPWPPSPEHLEEHFTGIWNGSRHGTEYKPDHTYQMTAGEPHGTWKLQGTSLWLTDLGGFRDGVTQMMTVLYLDEAQLFCLYGKDNRLFMFDRG